MLSQKEIQRYSRHLLLPEIGNKGQELLCSAKVLVIGAGGLGCPVLQYLTAAGVGVIGIVDFDRVEESNLQRQVLYWVDDIGKCKAETAVVKLSKQNPLVKFNSYNLYLNNENALDIIKDYDIVVDGTDNFATRYLINDVCVFLNKPFVYGSVDRFAGQVSVFNHTGKDGIKGPTYRCIFPVPPSSESALNCSESGVLGVLPGIIGTLQANEIIKIITGAGEILSGKLLLVDALGINFTTLEVKRTEEGISNVPQKAEAFSQMDYAYLCR